MAHCRRRKLSSCFVLLNYSHDLIFPTQESERRRVKEKNIKRDERNNVDRLGARTITTRVFGDGNLKESKVTWVPDIYEIENGKIRVVAHLKDHRPTMPW